MEDLFFVSVKDNLAIQKQDLVDSLNHKTFFDSNLKKEIGIDFFCNLFLSLAHHKNIEFGRAQTEDSRHTNQVHFDSFEAVIEAVLKSKGSITMSTSGTSGKSKNLVIPFSKFKKSLIFKNSLKNKTWGIGFSPFHLAGLQVLFQASLTNNLTVLFLQNSRSTIFEQIRYFQITHLSGTPTFYKMLLPISETFPSVERIVLGGERSGAGLFSQLEYSFPEAKFLNIYALTEAGTMLVSKSVNFCIPQKLRAVLKILDNQLFIHESLILDVSQLDLNDGWYGTKDIVEWKTEEEFEFVARQSEIINVAGNQVNIAKIEQVIESLNLVKQVRVFPKKNPITENIICCEVVTFANFDLEIFKEKLSEKLPKFMLPRIIKVVANIEQTYSGKTQRMCS